MNHSDWDRARNALRGACVSSFKRWIEEDKSCPTSQTENPALLAETRDFRKDDTD